MGSGQQLTRRTGSNMRIDKYLKNARIIKRRTVAKEACEQERVSLNGKIAKPGAEVTPGDVIHIEFGSGTMTLRVVSVPEVVRKEDAVNLYEILE